MGSCLIEFSGTSLRKLKGHLLNNKKNILNKNGAFSFHITKLATERKWNDPPGVCA